MHTSVPPIGWRSCRPRPRAARALEGRSRRRCRRSTSAYSRRSGRLRVDPGIAPNAPRTPRVARPPGRPLMSVDVPRPSLAPGSTGRRFPPANGDAQPWPHLYPALVDQPATHPRLHGAADDSASASRRLSPHLMAASCGHHRVPRPKPPTPTPRSVEPRGYSGVVPSRAGSPCKATCEYLAPRRPAQRALVADAVVAAPAVRAGQHHPVAGGQVRHGVAHGPRSGPRPRGPAPPGRPPVKLRDVP